MVIQASIPAAGINWGRERVRNGSEQIAAERIRDAKPRKQSGLRVIKVALLLIMSTCAAAADEAVESALPADRGCITIHGQCCRLYCGCCAHVTLPYADSWYTRCAVHAQAPLEADWACCGSRTGDDTALVSRQATMSYPRRCADSPDGRLLASALRRRKHHRRTAAAAEATAANTPQPRRHLQP